MSSVIKKKVDPRVRSLIEHTTSTNQRSFFCILGDRGRDQVVNLNFLLNKINPNSKKYPVLWCYKKDLGFSSNRKVRQKDIKKKISQGRYDHTIEDPFELFTSATDIRYCYYKDTESILGKTHSILILQDFESLTPNILCRTIETVTGGGIIILLLKTISSLQQLYNISMDIHKKFSNNVDNQDIVPRFNERFILSLTRCDNCLVLDDEMNLLPIAKNKAVNGEYNGEYNNGGSIITIDDGKKSLNNGGNINTKNTENVVNTKNLKKYLELESLKEDMKHTLPLGEILKLTKTLDQANAVMKFVDVISDKDLKQTVSLTAGRGRGKSASLGLALASSIVYGYSNIFVTAPSPSNLTTVFEFLLKGFDNLGYIEHKDYELIQSDEPTLHKAIIRINIFKHHRQTIQYISPEQLSPESSNTSNNSVYNSVLAQAELLIIDEAAAIPLPIVKSMIGPYLVLMSSTVNGYEGTGRSLSLKLIKDLKKENNSLNIKENNSLNSGGSGGGSLSRRGGGSSSRSLIEIFLDEPIRYGEGDLLEKWLNEVCCLNSSEFVKDNILKCGLPIPNNCELYMVNRNSLFSYHATSEKFLNKLMGLFVASHYKNTPNDLILLSDAPNHYIFVLLPPPQDDNKNLNSDPDIICAIHVAAEGSLTKEAVAASLARGIRPSGDLISWTISQQFNDENFGQLRGIRIVRIATHPAMIRKGYGLEAIKQLQSWFDLKRIPINGYTEDQDTESEDDNDDNESEDDNEDRNKDEDGNQDEKDEKSKKEKDGKKKSEKENKTTLQIRRKIPALLQPISETRPPFELDYMGTSFGLTIGLYEFWKKLNFHAVYLRQTPNDITGEHSCIMLRKAQTNDDHDDHDIIINGGISNNKMRTNETWLREFRLDFRNRFSNLLSSVFRKLPIPLTLSIMDTKVLKEGGEGIELVDTNKVLMTTPQSAINTTTPLTLETLLSRFSRHDLQRLERYAGNRAEYTLILDLLPVLSEFYFQGKFQCQLMAAQTAILLALGRQSHSMKSISQELGLEQSQTLALFSKVIFRLWGVIRGLLEEEITGNKTPMSIDKSNSEKTPPVTGNKDSHTYKAVPLNANLGGSVSSLTLEEEQNKVGKTALKELEKFKIPIVDTSKLNGNVLADGERITMKRTLTDKEISDQKEKNEKKAGYEAKRQKKKQRK